MPDKEKHHFVPAGLSRNFCIDGKALYLYDTLTGNIRKSSPRDALMQKHFHSIVREDGTRDHNEIEDMLNEKFESPGLPTIKKLIQNIPLTRNERISIANFWALQHSRTPIARSGVEEFYKASIKATGKILDLRGDLPPLPKVLRKHGKNLSELLDKGVFDIKVLEQVTMMSLVSIPQKANMIFSMNWCLLESDADNYFILSDNPCSLYDQAYRQTRNSFGLSSRGLELTLPIGKNHCLLAAWKSIPESSKATDFEVNEINRRTSIFGERFFVYPQESTEVMEFLKQCSGDTPRVTMEIKPTVGEKDEGFYVIGKGLTFKSKEFEQLYAECEPIFNFPIIL